MISISSPIGDTRAAVGLVLVRVLVLVRGLVVGVGVGAGGAVVTPGGGLRCESSSDGEKGDNDDG